MSEDVERIKLEGTAEIEQKEKLLVSSDPAKLEVRF
jgi:hypothetical protein